MLIIKINDEWIKMNKGIQNRYSFFVYRTFSDTRDNDESDNLWWWEECGRNWRWYQIRRRWSDNGVIVMIKMMMIMMMEIKMIMMTVIKMMVMIVGCVIWCLVKITKTIHEIKIGDKGNSANRPLTKPSGRGRHLAFKEEKQGSDSPLDLAKEHLNPVAS